MNKGVNLGIETSVIMSFEDKERDIELFFDKDTMKYTAIDIITNESWQWKANINPLTLTLEEQVKVTHLRYPGIDPLGMRNLRDPWMVGYGVNLYEYIKVQ